MEEERARVGRTPEETLNRKEDRVTVQKKPMSSNMRQYLITLLIIAATIPFTYLWAIKQFPFQKKYASFINYYDIPVKVDINGITERIEPGKSAIIPFTIESYTFTAVIRDSSNNVIDSRTHEVPKRTVYTLDLLSPSNATQLCIVSVNVQGYFYYSSLLANVLPKTRSTIFVHPTVPSGSPDEYIVLNNSPIKSITVATTLNASSTLFPGEYTGDKLPNRVSRSSDRAYAIIPIACEDKNNIAAINKATLYWLTQKEEK